jgi:hypothetical protein
MRPHGKYARVNPQDPTAFAVCDRCGFWRNRTDLIWQDQWAGTHLYNIQILVCRERCYDVPQEQLRTIILPPDPPPVLNARVPDFAYEEQTPIIFQFATPTRNFANQQPWGAGPQTIMCDQTGEVPLVLQYLTSS